MTQHVPSDIEIAQEAELKPIKDIAEHIGLDEKDWEPYGSHKGKVSVHTLKRLEKNEDGKLILVTSINPTPAGEGKSTVTVGLGQGLNRIGKNAIIALREPSLGPSMGMKGGAAGGGHSQIVPMEDINLHFTGDLHAITSAHNALAALLDNHIQQGNELDIDTRRIFWKRVLDMNDRALRNIVIGMGGPASGVPREDGFDITVASEIMAILCLSTDLQDMKKRFEKIVVAYNSKKEPVTVKDLGVSGALTLLMKNAINPNLVQTLENTPAFVHGGPFANIAHGCNSLVATKMAVKLGDFAVTEAGFGADLGAEKFLDIKSRAGGLSPNAVVLVVTARALKMHGGVDKKELKGENVEAIKKGISNLEKHIETVQSFNLPFVVAINKFATDTDEEIQWITDWCEEHGHASAVADVWAKGGEGGEALAKKVVDISDSEKEYQPLYDVKMPIKDKIEAVAQKVYGAAGVDFSAKALKQIKEFTDHGWNELPVCMAKTQYSLSDDPKKLGRPEGFTIHIRELKASIGAGFIVVLTGNVLTMPGLPKKPAALNMDVDENGRVSGLF